MPALFDEMAVQTDVNSSLHNTETESQQY